MGLGSRRNAAICCARLARPTVGGYIIGNDPMKIIHRLDRYLLALGMFSERTPYLCELNSRVAAVVRQGMLTRPLGKRRGLARVDSRAAVCLLRGIRCVGHSQYGRGRDDHGQRIPFQSALPHDSRGGFGQAESSPEGGQLMATTIL